MLSSLHRSAALFSHALPAWLVLLSFCLIQFNALLSPLLSSSQARIHTLLSYHSSGVIKPSLGARFGGARWIFLSLSRPRGKVYISSAREEGKRYKVLHIYRYMRVNSFPRAALRCRLKMPEAVGADA